MFIAFFARDISSIQIIAFTIINITVFTYIGVNRPLTLRYKNTLELFNEFFVVLISHSIFTFTDFVQDDEWKYIMGFYMIGLTSLSILLNFVVFMNSALHNLKLVLIKVFNIVKYRFNRCRKSTS